MSRSPVTCPRCGTAVADRRGKGRAAVRHDTGLRRVVEKPNTIEVTCPECGLKFDWLNIRVVLFELTPRTS